MPADLHSVERGEGNDAVSVRKIESAILWVQNLPFQSVLGFNEVVLASQGGSIGGLAQLTRTYGRSDQNTVTIRLFPKRCLEGRSRAPSRAFRLHRRSSVSKDYA
jgi:hypothetical protein